MKQYDANLPLTFIHVPKTAGLATTAVFQSWFKDRLLRYYHGNSNLINNINNLTSLHHPLPKHTCLYGHFKDLRHATNFFDKPIQQCIMMVRDPWEKALSGYFYRKHKGTPVAHNIEHFIKVTNIGYKQLTQYNLQDDYKEIINKYFVYIGLTHDINNSLQIIARLLGMSPLQATLPIKNAAPNRDEDEPLHLKQWFMEKHALDYEIYQYCCNLHQQHVKQHQTSNYVANNSNVLDIQQYNQRTIITIRNRINNIVQEKLQQYHDKVDSNYDVNKNSASFAAAIATLPVVFIANLQLQHCIDDYHLIGIDCNQMMQHIIATL